MGISNRIVTGISNALSDWMDEGFPNVDARGVFIVGIFSASFGVLRFITTGSDDVGLNFTPVVILLSICCSLVLGVVYWALTNKVDSHVLSFALIPAVYSLFLQASRPLVCEDLSVAFLLFTLLQGGLLAGTVYVFKQPVIPKPIQNETVSDPKEYLKVHLQNWWRIAQLSITIGVIALLALLTSVVPNLSGVRGIRDLGWLAFPFLFSLLPILVYLRLKMNYVEKFMSEY